MHCPPSIATGLGLEAIRSNNAFIPWDVLHWNSDSFIPFSSVPSIFPECCSHSVLPLSRATAPFVSSRLTHLVNAFKRLTWCTALPIILARADKVASHKFWHKRWGNPASRAVEQSKERQKTYERRAQRPAQIESIGWDAAGRKLNLFDIEWEKCWQKTYSHACL